MQMMVYSFSLGFVKDHYFISQFWSCKIFDFLPKLRGKLKSMCKVSVKIHAKKLSFLFPLDNSLEKYFSEFHEQLKHQLTFNVEKKRWLFFCATRHFSHTIFRLRHQNQAHRAAINSANSIINNIWQLLS